MRKVSTIILSLCAMLCSCAGVPESREGDVLRYKLEGEDCPFADFAEYGIYMPSGNDPIRAVMVLQHGCTMEQFGITKPYDLQYQAFADKWHIAFLETALHGDCHVWGQPENGSAPALMQILVRVGAQTNHPELSEVPWLLWGHSGGGYWLLAMLRDYPERILAAVSYSAAFDPQWDYSDAAAEVPLLLRHAGPIDAPSAYCCETAYHTFDKLRAMDAPVSIAYNHGQHHNLSHLRHMMIPFFESAMAQRLPDKVSQPMKPLDPEKCFLADTLTHQIFREAGYTGDKSTMCRFPDETSALKWKEFIETNDVADVTAPDEPYAISASIAEDGSVLLSWKAQADVESGIGHFNIFVDGEKVGSLPEEGEYQSYDRNGDNTYPIEPAAMEYRFEYLSKGRHTLGVETVNQSGLVSEMKITTITVK